jgi:hypothetical protein
VEERLKRYEALLRERGIDPSQATSASETEPNRPESRSEVPETSRIAANSTASESQVANSEPKLLLGMGGTKLVYK